MLSGATVCSVDVVRSLLEATRREAHPVVNECGRKMANWVADGVAHRRAPCNKRSRTDTIFSFIDTNTYFLHAKDAVFENDRCA